MISIAASCVIQNDLRDSLVEVPSLPSDMVPDTLPPFGLWRLMERRRRTARHHSRRWNPMLRRPRVATIVAKLAGTNVGGNLVSRLQRSNQGTLDAREDRSRQVRDGNARQTESKSHQVPDYYLRRSPSKKASLGRLKDKVGARVVFCASRNQDAQWRIVVTMSEQGPVAVSGPKH